MTKDKNLVLLCFILITIISINICYNELHKKELLMTTNYIEIEDSIDIGLYSSTNELLTNYSSNFIKNQEIGLFSTFLTNELKLDNINHKELWLKYYNNYQNISNYKIGYNLTFTINNKDIINKDIYNINDISKISEYLEIYLYDDTWEYSNPLIDINNNNLITSLKLIGGPKVENITSDIILTSYLYNPKDHQKINSYSLTISKS